ncbi:MAG TPA: hypothetical protein VF962_13945 [Gemmatimonadaceae bacterium]
MMKQTLYACVVGGIALALQLSCNGGEIAAPPVSEQLTISVSTRAEVPGEPVPAIKVSGGATSLSFQVTRAAVPCAAVVNAGLSRVQHELSVVARVWSDPLIDCIAPTQRNVVDYGATILVIDPGPYLVRIFEANGNETPHLIGSGSARVSIP